MSRIEGEGTPEEQWRPWIALQRWPLPDLAGIERLLIVAPHPDDETLGLGGTIALVRAAGMTVDVLALTDGEASHPDSRVLERHELAARRVAETQASLGLLGVPELPLHRLGLPDGAASSHEAALGRELCRWLDPATACFTTYEADGHPDHEAAGRAAASACRCSGARLFTYPIWSWHWASPGDGRLPWDRARRIPLPWEVRRRKVRAIQAFRTQVAPIGDAPGDAAILPPCVCERFRRDAEIVFAS